MPHTRDPRPLHEWSDDEINHEVVRGLIVMDCLSRNVPVMVGNLQVLDRCAEGLRVGSRP